MKHLLRPLLIVALATSERTLPARAQALCSYDQCALRLHRGSLVQGLGGTRVARLRGWFCAPRIDLLENAGDSTRQHYLAFRALYHQGAKFRTASLALVMATAITLSWSPSGAVSWHRASGLKLRPSRRREKLGCNPHAQHRPGDETNRPDCTEPWHDVKSEGCRTLNHA